MKQRNKNKQGKKRVGRIPAQPTGVTELTEHDLEQVQGGMGAASPQLDAAKIPPGPAEINYQWIK